MNLPTIALSIRQPWAWAIIAGFKDVENRSTFAVTKGSMQPRHIAVHAAKGMTVGEYEDAANFMAHLGVECPRPDDLVRGAVIGGVTVKAVVKSFQSRWFFGPRGLVLADAYQVDPIPATGALGYFEWRRGGALASPLPWMRAWPKKQLRQQVANNQPQKAAFPLFE